MKKYEIGIAASQTSLLCTAILDETQTYYVTWHDVTPRLGRNGYYADEWRAVTYCMMPAAAGAPAQMYGHGYVACSSPLFLRARFVSV